MSGASLGLVILSPGQCPGSTTSFGPQVDSRPSQGPFVGMEKTPCLGVLPGWYWHKRSNTITLVLNSTLLIYQPCLIGKNSVSTPQQLLPLRHTVWASEAPSSSYFTQIHVWFLPSVENAIGMVYLFQSQLYLVYFVVESLLTAPTISLLTKRTRLTIVMGGLPTASVVVMESLLVSRILCSCLGLPHLFSGQTKLI